MRSVPPDERPIRIREILGRLEHFRLLESQSAENATGDFKEHTKENHLRNARALNIAIDLVEDEATDAVLPARVHYAIAGVDYEVRPELLAVERRVARTGKA